MTDTCSRIQQLLEQAFQPEQLQIEDESWKHAGHAGAREHGGGHFIVHITASAFNGLPRPHCHRMIYQALDSLFPEHIHALSIHIGKTTIATS